MRLRWLAASLLAAIAGPSLAGPPYQTDDPEPTELHKWEIYNFAVLDGVRGDVDGEGGLDLNYGPVKDVQLTATLPIAFSHDDRSGWRGGTGEVELAAKYRFVNDKKSGVQVAAFPRVILPTASHHLGGSKARLLLPVWAQKGLGKTAIFGGGAFEINRGSGNRDFCQAGVALVHDFSDSLQLGTEVNWQSADVRGGRSTTGVNVGMIKQLGGPFELLAAAGPTFSGGKSGYHAYAAIGLNF